MADARTAPAREDARNFDDFWCPSEDGLALYARDYGPRTSRLAPVICIPGLTRTTRDFHALATHLASRPRKRRRVLALDLRGRGRSDRDRRAANYSPKRETLDVLDVMTAAGIERAVVIGTSRGGLVAMAIGAARPAALAGVVLNDIGPRIEAQGILRIIGQLSRMPRPRSWEEATALMKRLFAENFTDLSDEDWETFARQVFRDDNGRPRPDFDPRIVRSLDRNAVTTEGLPELWPLFGALSHVPVLAIRGANSDILSPATLEEMARRHPDFMALTVAHRGHAPFLTEEPAIAAIDELMNRVDHRAATG
jgi:pimeloyl-ACP methyl ester carboxylesterase